MAVNIICKATCDNPWFFNCASKYIRWLATVRMCSICAAVERVAVIYIPRSLVTVTCSIDDKGSVVHTLHCHAAIAADRRGSPPTIFCWKVALPVPVLQLKHKRSFKCVTFWSFLLQIALYNSIKHVHYYYVANLLIHHLVTQAHTSQHTAHQLWRSVGRTAIINKQDDL